MKMKSERKWFKVVLTTLFLFVATFFLFKPTTVNADGNEVTPTSSSATLINTDTGKEYNGETINQYTTLKIKFDFNFHGQNIKNGDYFNFVINNAGNYLKLANDQRDIPLLDENNNNLGTAHLTVEDGNITGRVDLNALGADAEGNFEVSLQADQSKTGDNKDFPITVTVSGKNQPNSDKTIHYIANSDKTDETFSKSSANDTLKSNPNYSGQTDPNYYNLDDITKGNLTYSVRYIHRDSTGGTSTVPVHITDSLQTPDFTYDQSSFLLYKVKWRYGTDGKWTYNDENNHGTYKYVQPSDYTLTWGSDDKSFDLKFTAQDLKDLDGYVLFYGLLYKGKPVNKITDATLKPANGTIIRNTATLELPNTTPISYPQTMVVKGSDGTIHFKRFTLQVNKTDQNGTPLNGVTFQLWDKKTNTLVDTQTTQTTGGGARNCYIQ